MLQEMQETANTSWALTMLVATDVPLCNGLAAAAIAAMPSFLVLQLFLRPRVAPTVLFRVPYGFVDSFRYDHLASCTKQEPLQMQNTKPTRTAFVDFNFLGFSSSQVQHALGFCRLGHATPAAHRGDWHCSGVEDLRLWLPKSICHSVVVCHLT